MKEPPCWRGIPNSVAAQVVVCEKLQSVFRLCCCTDARADAHLKAAAQVLNGEADRVRPAALQALGCMLGAQQVPCGQPQMRQSQRKQAEGKLPEMASQDLNL